MFHVSVLQKCLVNPCHQITLIDLLDQFSSLVLLPKDVLQCKTISRGSQQIPQCLIKWSGLPVSDATWEDAHTLLHKFPDQNLGDMVRLHGGGIVTNKHDTPQGLRRSSREKVPPKYLDHYVVPDPKKINFCQTIIEKDIGLPCTEGHK